MLKNIRLNLNALEYTLFVWQSAMDREKVSEYYLTELAALPEMGILYDNEFTEESVRKVLSAISNREMLNTDVLKERQFWNNHLGVIEDRELLDARIAPIKTLSLESIKSELNASADIPFDTVEIIFIPGIKEEYRYVENRIYINFFSVMVDIFGGTGDVTIGGLSPKAYVADKIIHMDGVTKK